MTDTIIKGPHQFDHSNLRKVILDAPRQFAVGFDLGKDVKLDGNFKRAFFYGEGGSAFPVSLVKTLLCDCFENTGEKHGKICQNYTYHLKRNVSDSALNVFCSYSGNTEETITTLNAAIVKGLPAIGIAGGGKVEEICKVKNIPFVKLPTPFEGFQPRMGTGYFIGAILQVLQSVGLAPDLKDEILGTVPTFDGKMSEYEAKGQELAAKIVGKTPLVWSSQKFRELARVWTIKFNEHAKNPSFWNFFSELNHNLMVGLTNLGDHYFAIMLRDPDDDAGNLRRYEITADILKRYNMESEILDLAGETVFTKLFNSIYLADFTAYYLAEVNKVDPTPVDMVEEFKKRLKHAGSNR